MFGNKPKIEDIQKNCDHSIIPYYVETHGYREGTAMIHCICEHCAKKFPPSFYDNTENDNSPEFERIIKFTEHMNEVLKNQNLKINWNNE